MIIEKIFLTSLVIVAAYGPTLAEHDQQRLIVHCKPRTEAHCRQRLLEGQQQYHIVKEMPGSDYFAIEVPTSKEPSALLQELGDVLDTAEADPVRSFFASANLRGHRGLDEHVPWGIQMVDAIRFWNVYGNKGSHGKVCIIDSGLMPNHEDFQYENIDGTTLGGIPWDHDGLGHGTHVAGTVAAADNGKGVVGVCPDCHLHIVRVFDSNGYFYGSDLIEAMEACLAQPNVDVISMSLGGPGSSSAELQVMENAITNGTVVVASSGNDGDWRSGYPGGENYPASYEPVMGVGAVRSDKLLSEFSTYGPHVSVTAPGTRVLSASVNGASEYEYMDGTSMAAPHVAGIVGLLRSHQRASGLPSSDPISIRQAIEESADRKLDDYNEAMYGHGIANAASAAEALYGSTPDCPDCVRVRVSLTLDHYGGENTWEIFDQLGMPVRGGGPFFDRSNGDQAVDEFDLPRNDCYKFVLRDDNDDGMCCQYGRGGYRLESDGSLVVESFDFGAVAGEDNSERVHYFGEECDANPVCGNGQPETGEECDDGVDNSNNGRCTLECKWNVCGDGHLYEGVEECDSGVEGGTPLCSEDCRSVVTCEEGFKPVRLELVTDAVPGASSHPEISWCVTEAESGTLLAVGDSLSAPSSHSKTSVCVPMSQCYHLAVHDPMDTGAGAYHLFWDNEVVYSGVAVEDEVVVEFGACADLNVEFELTTDGYGSETSWVLSENGVPVYQEPESGSSFADYTTYTTSGTLSADSCWEVQVLDSYGDGFCCSYGSGSFVVKVDGVIIDMIGSEFSGSAAYASRVISFGNCGSRRAEEDASDQQRVSPTALTTVMNTPQAQSNHPSKVKPKPPKHI